MSPQAPADDRFAPDHLDDDEYEYPHRDGTSVKVKIDERRNGGRVSVYHYSEDGDRMSYHSLRINDLEMRKLVASKSQKEKPIPDEVVIALHAGGWEIANMKPGGITPREEDPVEIQLLDIRDGFNEYADQTDSEIMEIYFESMARAVEIGVVTETTLRMVEMEGDQTAEEALMDAKSSAGAPASAMELRDHVEGWFINAVDPSTQRSTIQHDRIVNALETARDAYRRGQAFGDTFQEAYHNMS